MRRIFLMSLTVFMMWICAACGGAAKNDSASKEFITGAVNNYAMSYDSEDMSMVTEETKAAMGEEAVAVETGRKLIKEVDMSIETKHFDDFISNLETEVVRVGGYLENASVGGTSYYSNGSSRSAWFTARIPVESLETFIEQMGENGNVTNISRNVRDVTLEYVDVEGRIASLEAQVSNDKQSAYLLDKLSPCPRPAYLTCNPNAPYGLGYGIPYGYGVGACGASIQ